MHSNLPTRTCMPFHVPHHALSKYAPFVKALCLVRLSICLSIYSLLTSCLPACLLDCLAVWLFGCLAAWLLGCLAAWLLGCLAAWLLECLSAWRVITPQNPRIKKPPSCESGFWVSKLRILLSRHKGKALAPNSDHFPHPKGQGKQTTGLDEVGYAQSIPADSCTSQCLVTKVDRTQQLNGCVVDGCAVGHFVHMAGASCVYSNVQLGGCFG